MAIRVLIVDDEPNNRLLLRLNLARADHVELVAEADGGVSAAGLAAEHHPDVVVLDWMMPGMTGVEAIPLIRRGSPRSLILMYSSRCSAGAEEQALAAGADCYLEKRGAMDSVVEALRRLAADDRDGHIDGREVPRSRCPASVVA
jgi:DNA-binding NarL/FixJ family response regulator